MHVGSRPLLPPCPLADTAPGLDLVERELVAGLALLLSATPGFCPHFSAWVILLGILNMAIL
jgi:hypothetical protein